MQFIGRVFCIEIFYQYKFIMAKTKCDVWWWSEWGFFIFRSTVKALWGLMFRAHECDAIQCFNNDGWKREERMYLFWKIYETFRVHQISTATSTHQTNIPWNENANRILKHLKSNFKSEIMWIFFSRKCVFWIFGFCRELNVMKKILLMVSDFVCWENNNLRKYLFNLWMFDCSVSNKHPLFGLEAVCEMRMGSVVGFFSWKEEWVVFLRFVNCVVLLF